MLDVDPRNDGDASLAELEKAHGALETLTVNTGGGGLHLYLSGDVPPRKALLPGIDLQGVGNYVVCPPSKHGSCCRYTWDLRILRIAPIPAWLAELARTGAEGTQPAPAPPFGETIPEGRRNASLISLAGSLRRRGLVADEIIPTLAVVNARRCRPPLPYRELEAIARSAMRWEPVTALGTKSLEPT